MSFKQYLGAEVARRLEETYRAEHVAATHPGKAYYQAHLDTIEGFETNAAVLREFLGGGGMRVLESGCASVAGWRFSHSSGIARSVWTTAPERCASPANTIQT